MHRADMIAYDFESLVSLATQGKIAENFFQSNDLQKQKPPQVS